MLEGKSAATPWVSFDSNRAQLDLYNEVHYISELPLDPKWQAVKVERSKKKSVYVKKSDFFLFFQVSRPVFLNPVGVQRDAVPHFKGLIKPELNQMRPWA